MMTMPAHKNTSNPPGQIVNELKYRPVQGMYLRDIIERIERDERREDEFPFGLPEDVYLELIGKDNE